MPAPPLPIRSSSALSESYVSDAFHRYLKSSLSQAKAEHLLDPDILAGAEGDLMITGPALCLYFAALRCTTNPPSVPLPRSSKSATPMELSYDNCPEPFIAFLRVWSKTVAPIQSLAPELQHDLARIICGLQPIVLPTEPSLNGIAADLRAVAIEISQRRSFQERYGEDLQAALDSGAAPATPSPKRATFVPPPVYDPSPTSSANSSPRSSLDGHASPQYANRDLPPQSPSFLSPAPASAGPSNSGFPKASPSLLTPDSPAIEFIRETLYACIADALELQPSLRALLKTDPTRAYFASVAFAILQVATTSVTPDNTIVGVLGQTLTIEQCPPPLRPFMSELAAIGQAARALEDEDNETAMDCVQHGKPIPTTRMDRVRLMLEQGVGYAQGRTESEEGRRSVEGRAVSFTNRVNALSLGMTRLKAFRERQEDVFKVLGGIGM
ncbi:hypothetical protein MIND_01016100 [Mycena indigotica]|uniref:Uncharacterized protein n=1 Tax=Mycena indigotica TaxID=2126181 RepID=A0A8H6S8H4_9AGAR|nr:uncharacterized protein MIND_01016100 [Mycena indigotica]KAF7294784.1 hypothetical protein MIND_01016100 [Mycena indigotica]